MEGIASQPLSSGNVKAKGRKFKWTAYEDKIYLPLLREFSLNGGKEGMGFKKEAWQEIGTKLNTQLGTRLDRDQLKSRLKYYRSCYTVIDDLTRRTGFGWDDSNKMVTAEQDKWDELITTNAEYEKYKRKEMPNYDDLLVICGSSTASGFGASSSKGKGVSLEIPRENVQAQDDDVEEVSIAQSTQHNIDDMIDDELDENPTSNNQNRKYGSCKQKKNSGKGQKGSAFEAINAINKLAESHIQASSWKKEQAEKFSVKECLDVLDAMVLSPELHVAACLALRKRANREMFLLIRDSLRLHWLKKICGHE